MRTSGHDPKPSVFTAGQIGGITVIMRQAISLTAASIATFTGVTRRSRFVSPINRNCDLAAAMPRNSHHALALFTIERRSSMKRISIILAVLLGSCSFAFAQGASSAGGGSASGTASTGSSTSTGSPGSNSTTGSAARPSTQSPSAGNTAPGGYNPNSPTGNMDTGVLKR